MKRRTALAAALAAGAVPLPMLAQTNWPSRPITMVVPFPPGGSTDAVARLIAQRLGDKLGQNVVVDNRAGAGGNIGTDVVAKAAPDGHTIGLSTSGPLANNKFLYKNMPFDPLKDLTPIVAVGEIPLGIAVSASNRAGNLREFIADARSRPGRVTVANPGNGTIGHLTAELIRSQANVQWINVPYKGDTPAVTDVLAGTVDALVTPITALLPHIQGGRMKALAVTSKQRMPALPNVPTAVEQGVNAESAVWFGIVGPANLPPAIVQRLNTEVNAILQTPEARQRLGQYGASVVGGNPQQLGQLLSSDSAKWKTVIETAHITLE